MSENEHDDLTAHLEQAEIMAKMMEMAHIVVSVRYEDGGDHWRSEVDVYRSPSLPDGIGPLLLADTLETIVESLRAESSVRRVDGVVCPVPECGANLDAARSVTSGNPQPVPGAFTVCAYCGGIAVYVTGVDGQLVLRTPTEEEVLNLTSSPAMQAMLNVIRANLLEKP